MSDSIWKKEISFSRKKAKPEPEPAAPADEAKQSVWKKEISFSRKPKAEAAKPKQSLWKKEISFSKKPKAETAPPPVAAAAAAEPKQSVWKKEISLSLKKRDRELERIAQDAAHAVSPSFVFAPAPAEQPPTAAPEAVPAAMPQAVAEDALAVPPAEPAPVGQAEAGPATPVWLPAPEDVPLPEVPAPLQVAPSPLLEPVAVSTPFEPLPVEPQPTPPAPVEPAPAEPVTAAEPEPVESAPVTPVPELPLDAVAEQPAQPAPVEQPAPVASAPLSTLSPAILAASSDPGPSLPNAADVAATLPAGPVPFPEQPLAAAEPEPDEPVQHAPPPAEPLQPPLFAPSPAEPLQPLSFAPPPAEPLQPPTLTPSFAPPPAEPLQPLSFAPPPTAPLQPPSFAPPPAAPLQPLSFAPPVEPLQPLSFAPPPAAPLQPPSFAPPVEPLQPPPLAFAAPPDDSWLASPELPPAPAASPPVAVHPPVPAADLPPVVAAKVPFWKKELSLSRKPKSAAAPQPAPAAAAVDGIAAPSGPWWKKELSFSRKPKPAAAAAAVPEARTPWWKKQIGRKQAAAPVPVTADEQTTEVVAQPSAPFWKRELSFGKPKLPSRSKLPKQKGSGRGTSSKGAKRLVGLKIGASQLAAARVSNNGVAELEQVARQPLPMGIVVGGELRDPDALAEALKAFFAKNKLPRKGVRLGIANNRIGVRIFDIVGVEEEKQLANAIQFRAQEALPIPLDEAVLDYHVLDESVDDEGRSVKRVLLVVAYKELIERYVGACRKAGITLAGIDLEAFALLRSLSPPTEGGSAALVAVAIGYDRSTFAVSDGRVCEFTRVLEWGGWSLNVALARAFDTAPSEVEALKCSLSLDGSTAPEGVSPEQTATAVETIERQVQSFARELVSSLQFYQNQPGSLGIGEIVITGGTAELPGLAAELERLIGVHVRVGDPLARLKVSKRVGAPAQLGSLAVAIGLGIED